MMNQCDGCRQKAPLKLSTFGGTLHVDKEGKAFMGCDAYRYTYGFDEEFENEYRRSLEICRGMQKERQH